MYDQVLKTAGEEIGSDYYVAAKQHSCNVCWYRQHYGGKGGAGSQCSINAEQVPSEEIFSEMFIIITGKATRLVKNSRTSSLPFLADTVHTLSSKICAV